jgi:hypothetical protein
MINLTQRNGTRNGIVPQLGYNGQCVFGSSLRSRPDIGAATAAGRAGEPRLQIRQGRASSDQRRAIKTAKLSGALIEILAQRAKRSNEARLDHETLTKPLTLARSEGAKRKTKHPMPEVR